MVVLPCMSRTVLLKWNPKLLMTALFTSVMETLHAL